MDSQEKPIFGIDLGTTYSCISYVDEYGKAVVVPNKEHNLTTPSVVLFEDENRIVGDEAKNSAMLNSANVVEMVKRHMGEADWRFSYEEKEYTAEEVSSYILRKLAVDTEESLGIEVKDVVITCPAYFGIVQREATVRAGEIAGFKVHEVINEPTAAAITYGLQNEQDQVVLVYDLGGGTFDITVIEIKGGAITVIATGGDHNLGGRNWDEKVVIYLAEQWKNETGSSEDPIDSPDTLQDLWLKAEKAKQTLTPRNETKIVFSHAGQPVKVALTRDKFNNLTEDLLARTISYTNVTLNDARERGYTQFDQILLVGGSTKMPQVAECLDKEFHIPYRLFEPDEAVAKGAAQYGSKLILDQKIQSKISEITHTPIEEVNTATVAPAVMEQAQEDVARDLGLRIGAVKKLADTSITNVASHSFGLVVTADYGKPSQREAISNLVVANDPLPAKKVQTFGTVESNQDSVELHIMENAEKTALVEEEKYKAQEAEIEIGKVVLELPPGLPENAPIEVTFALNQQGRLHVVGREPKSGNIIEGTFEAKGGISAQELKEAKSRSISLIVS